MTAADHPSPQPTPPPTPADSAQRLEAATRNAREATAQLEARLRLGARMLKCFDRLAAQEQARAAGAPAPAPSAGDAAARAGGEAIERAEAIIDTAEHIERNIVSMVFRAAELFSETQSAAGRRDADATMPHTDGDGSPGAKPPGGGALPRPAARAEPVRVDEDGENDDLAELREMNEELRAQLAAVEEQYDRLVAYQAIHDESDDLTARVLATVSDEIRSPIETIARLVELMAETGLDRVQRGYLSEAQSAVSSLQELMQCVPGAPHLDGERQTHPADAREEGDSRASQSDVPSAGDEADDDPARASRLERFELPSFLQEIVGEVRPVAEGKGIRIVATVEGEAPPLFGDRPRLRQALLYALTRAVQCAAEGEIMLRARAARRPGRSLAAQFTIIGLGAPPEARATGEAPAIVGRSDPADDMIGASAGFGLNIARQLIESLGGVLGITVIDEQRFEITLTADLRADAGERGEAAGGGGPQTYPRLPQEGLHSNLGRVLDLSLDGMRIVSVRVPPEDEPVDVVLRDPDGRVKLKARVVWSRRVGFRRHEIGLRFLEVTRELASELTRVSLNHRVPTTLADGRT
ncbi:MAG: PilZ domain-containing protein [Planctomycetota bacterium]|nr:PilZ domain-containing protein [Planctomycetota bacterium]